MDEKNIQLSFSKAELRIAKHLFKTQKKQNPRQIAKDLKINHANVNRLCNLLYKKNLLKKEELGNSSYYSYSNNTHPVNFIAYILTLERLPVWLNELQHKLEEFKDIRIGAVFGSAIKRKDYNDIDILLVYEPEDAEKIRKIKDSIRRSQLIKKPIRYVDMTEQDILDNKDDPVIQNMLSDNIIFKGAEEYARLRCRT